MKSSQVKFTYEDFLLFPDDGRRHELIDGDHYVTPSPITKHQKASLNLAFAIERFLRSQSLGQLFTAPYDVVLSDLDVVEPDLIFVTAANASIITEKNIRGVPDLVVEILSESTRKTDEVIKKKLYERFGVSEYWIADPELEMVKVYRLVEGRYVRTAELSRETDDTLSTPLLPGLKIPLSEIFA